MSERRFSYVQLDVFSSNPLEGNMLAVFTDARGLSTDEMQALARETNLSETTFVLPRGAETENKEGYKVRIFTVQEELKFAGHPTLGTAWYLANRDTKEAVVLDLPVGKIPVQFQRDNGKIVFGEMTQRDPEFGEVHEPEAVADALGIGVSDLDPSVPIQTVSTGMAFAMVPFRSLRKLENFSLNWGRVEEYLSTTDAKFLYLVTRETVDPKATLHARMIFYNGEDPATGSAAGCCTGWAVKYGILPSDMPGMIEQGLEMKRPSMIHIRATKHGERVFNVRVGGSVVKSFEGIAEF